MTFFPPPNPRVPPEAPQRHHDPNQWRTEDGKRGRMPVSTTQILLAILLVAIASSFAAFCFGFSGERGLDGAILSPQDGGEYEPGLIVVRIRASGGDDPPRWVLSYHSLANPDDWLQIGEGNSHVSPRNIGRDGLETLVLDEHGDYEMRLVVDNWNRTEQKVYTSRFTVAP